MAIAISALGRTGLRFCLCLLFCLSIAPATAQTVLGRWCDQMLPSSQTMNRVITLEITDDGSTISKSDFHDGSHLEQPLTEQSGGIFLVVDSPFGDRYRVVSATGELQLLDDDGLIRIARPLETIPQPNDCIR